MTTSHRVGHDCRTMLLVTVRWIQLARLLAFLTALSLSVSLPTPGHAQSQAPAQAETAMVVNADATFVRAAPNVRAAVVTSLERGARIQVLDRSSGDWWRVRGGDPPVEGYVHRLVLAAAPAARHQPPPPPEAPATPDPAQEQEQEPAEDTEAPPAPALRPGILLTGGVGIFFPTARDTFDAVGITGSPFAYGGTLEALRLWRSVFVRATIDWTSETGERVFLADNGERFPLGIPLDVQMLPIDIGAGWRFDPRKPRRSVFVPFVGGGVGLLRYRESDPSAEEEEIDESFFSYHLLAGVDVYFHRIVGGRAEYRFRHVPDSLGNGGVSAVTGDTSLGGSVLYFGIVLGR